MSSADEARRIYFLDLRTHTTNQLRTSPDTKQIQKVAEELTLRYRIIIVWPIAIAQQMLRKHNPRIELLLQQVAFIEEEDDVDVREEFVRHDGAPEQEGVFEPVDARVFC